MALSKYQEVAKRIKTLLETKKFNLDMSSFSNKTCILKHFEESKGDIEKVEGLSCHLLCVLAFEDKMPTAYRNSRSGFNYVDYSVKLTSLAAGTYIWDFLFSHKWTNSLEQAIKRCDYIIENNSTPPLAEWDSFK